MRIRLLIAAAALPFALWALLPLPSDGASPSSRLNDVQKKIQTTRGKIGRRKGTERVLTTQISAYNARIGTLQARIAILSEAKTWSANTAAMMRIPIDAFEAIATPISTT